MKKFTDLYAEVSKASKVDLEKMRKKCFWRVAECIVLAIAFAVLGMYLQNNILLNVGLILCIILAIVFMIGPVKSYQKVYKEKVVKTFIKAYDKNLEFWYERGIPKATYQEGEFEHFDNYHSEDLIIGNIDGRDIMMGEVHTEDESTDDEGHTTYTTIFHGLFGFIKLNNSYNGMVKIHADKGFFGKVFQDKKRIEMDSSEFEKYFDVIADDQIQAMQILTSDIMNKMLDFIKNSKIKFELTIKNNRLYIRFRTGAMFEGNIFKSSVHFDTLKKVYDMINFTFDVTRDFAQVIDETQL